MREAFSKVIPPVPPVRIRYSKITSQIFKGKQVRKTSTFGLHLVNEQKMYKKDCSTYTYAL